LFWILTLNNVIKLLRCEHNDIILMIILHFILIFCYIVNRFYSYWLYIGTYFIIAQLLLNIINMYKNSHRDMIILLLLWETFIQCNHTSLFKGIFFFFKIRVPCLSPPLTALSMNDTCFSHFPLPSQVTFYSYFL